LAEASCSGVKLLVDADDDDDAAPPPPAAAPDDDADLGLDGDAPPDGAECRGLVPGLVKTPADHQTKRPMHTHIYRTERGTNFHFLDA